MQAPEVHTIPVAQMGFVPHLQAPAVQVSARVPQSVQASPPAPHADGEVPDAQELPLQQPEAQLVGLQTQVPLLHCWPARQALPLPHWQFPPLEQLLAVVEEQALQLAPPAPHRASVGGLTQLPPLPPLQHPPAQLVPSQTQLPARHRLPTEHSAFVPQRQLPLELHESARDGSQPLHAAPPVPQSRTVAGLTQVAPLQQPAAQLPALQPVHAWAVQVPAPHEAHVAPPVPHSVASVPALH
jgi:hypothetical protein